MNDADGDYSFSMSFLYPLIWNLLVYFVNQVRIWGCVFFGYYGIFFRNDRGDYMNACMVAGTTGIDPADIFLDGGSRVAPA